MSDHGRYCVDSGVRHLDEYGCCECVCEDCTTPANPPSILLHRCICPDCNTDECGLHAVGGTP